ncbi:MAG: nucleoside-diphosphate kinase [Candidatus Kapaibacterium sp.]
MGNRTLAMIKPRAFERNLTGGIISKITEAGFRIIAMKMVKLKPAEAGEFYAVHKGRPFYEDLVGFMSSGPIVALALEKENAIADFRQLIGATDPAEAAVGTIRREFAESKTKNAVHGSDSDENAEIEIGFFFSKREIISNRT